MMDNPFVNDSPPVKTSLPGKWVDGTITSSTPLLVRLDGYQESPQPPTKLPLVGGLAVNDRVLCLLQGRQLIIFGRYGG